MYDSLNNLYEVSIELRNKGFCKSPAKKIISMTDKVERETKRLNQNDLKYLLQQVTIIDSNQNFQKSYIADNTIKSCIITYSCVIYNYKKHISRILLAMTFNMPNSGNGVYLFNPQSALIALLQCIKTSKNIIIEQRSLNWLSKNANTYNQLIIRNNENWLKEATEQIAHFKNKLGKYRLHKKFSLENISWEALLQEIEISTGIAYHNIIISKQNRNNTEFAPSSTSLILMKRHPANSINHHCYSQAYKRIAERIIYFTSFVPGHREYNAEKALNMGANISMN
ncbi:MAG: hypothetical protein GY821_07875, partial [Gammaproteobacteria bacterium]|nr:hypothetical protein [Gammaproteobacteria bacterium]